MVSDDTPLYLLQTKLYPPRVPGRLVLRRHLIERLERGQNEITLFSAPAGYGKSTLVAQWLESHGRPYAWLSLDEYDTGLDIVLAYIIAALQTVIPEVGQETSKLLALPRLPKPERVTDTFLVDLQHLVDPLCLVLDDYHTIADPAVHLFMMHLLRRLPQAIRVIIISRADPPLDLAQLRGKERLCEFRGSDLRFSLHEASSLIEQIIGQPVAEETARVIMERTEGWPVGLRLAAMSLKASDDHAEFTRRYAEGGHKFVSDYLLGEVLEQLPNEQRLLLLRTAVLDRFCAPLIDVLAEQSLPGSNGYDFLQALWSSNFFLIALDGKGTWYRYHQLFRQLLSQQLQQLFSAEEIALLHVRVSSWFEKAGYIEDAIIHAVKAGQPQAAAKLVEKYILNQEDWRRVERWVNYLPEEARRRPGIITVQAMLEQFRYRVGLMVPLLDEAEEALKSGEFDYTPAQQEAWLGVINAHRATIFFPSNRPQDILRLANRALRQVDPAAVYVRSLAEMYYICALQMSGESQQGIDLARKKLANQTGPPDVRTLHLMLAQCATYYGETNLFHMRNQAQAYLDLALQMKHQVSIGWANFCLGWCAYQENKLSAAEYYFSEVIYNIYYVNVRAAIDCLTGLALTKYARGEAAEAQNKLQDLRQFMVERSLVAMLPLADSLAVHLDPDPQRGIAAQGQTTRLAAQLAADLWELPVLTACKMDIESGEEQRLADAEKTLAQCWEFAQSRNAKRQLLQIGALETLVHGARGDNGRALDRLKESVLLAEPGGALRIFVDFGPALLPYFEQLLAGGVAPSYINSILAVYSDDSTARAGEREKGGFSPTAVALVAEITNREMDVLLLLAERLTNKEIAARLHISPRTVKKHTINLYQKLEVENRRQAAARARELGIV